jgi:hypothetical protein
MLEIENEASRAGRRKLEIAGWPVTVTSYTVAGASVTEIALISSGTNIARGVAETPEASRGAALEAASRRLLRAKHLDLTVGG